MKLTKEEIELLKKRKKYLENYQLILWILLLIFCVMIVIGNFLAWILLIVFVLTVPSHWKRKKELDEIKFKLAGVKNNKKK